MKLKKILYLLISLLLLSCENEDAKTKLFVSNFFDTIKDTSIKVENFYPLFDSLDVNLKSDVLAIDEKVLKYSDTLEVKCLNSYSDEKGFFKQDSIYFYIKKIDDKLVIVDSRGFVKIDNETLKFISASTGVNDLSKYKDLELYTLKNNSLVSYLFEYYRANYILKEGVKVTYWEWETSYSGVANGEVYIVNKLPISVYDVKYKVTYYDSNGIYITEDKGSVCNKLKSGEKFKFSFWSSHTKYPKNAKVELVFSDETIINVMYSYSMHLDN